ncbi:hypothetical protein [Rhizosaccharibacter radicis]|uniref:DHH family phosphoesterase n=1 Tax=Rhizosaccharibacter radicis TaxID=2782605 RepID=A0ABT1W1G6_9PROT|nr:hypothetical protein [Acetobacteraceae bacterium KSS12]
MRQDEFAHEVGRRFAEAVSGEGPAGFGAGPVLLLSHDDADGLSSAAILSRSLARMGREPVLRLVGRGENAWSAAMRTELAGWRIDGQEPGALIVADLGLRAEMLRPGMPTIVIDHHVTAGGLRTGVAADRVLGLTGYGADPVPTSSLMSYWCARGLAEAGLTPPPDDLLWLAAIGILGDLGDKAPFPELADARAAVGITALRNAVSLLNAARRSGSGDARPAYEVLREASGPKDVTNGRHPGTARLLDAKAEVAAALDAARRIAPVVRPPVVLIRLHSPCQIHPLVAQSWRTRLKDSLVMAANTGFRPGWVNFAMRTATDTDLVAWLRARTPEGADEQYGNGHAQASGGALPVPVWERFIAGLGFGADESTDRRNAA